MLHVCVNEEDMEKRKASNRKNLVARTNTVLLLELALHVTAQVKVPDI
jgi:hypothetical protein